MANKKVSAAFPGFITELNPALTEAIGPDLEKLLEDIDDALK